MDISKTTSNLCSSQGQTDDEWLPWWSGPNTVKIDEIKQHQCQFADHQILLNKIALNKIRIPSGSFLPMKAGLGLSWKKSKEIQRLKHDMHNFEYVMCLNRLFLKVDGFIKTLLWVFFVFYPYTDVCSALYTQYFSESCKNNPQAYCSGRIWTNDCSDSRADVSPPDNREPGSTRQFESKSCNQ